ncbi:hypothetical protein F5Y18DRAFT_398549 [Xylariaceae sp. FL1019]|nr:hypothetical protein F5Y18DRAFT_398549 [Xylariaceae sp. FL1019]
MHLTNIFVALTTSLLLASSAQATYVLAVFQDEDCVTPVANQAETQVLSGTCDSNVKVGYKSIKVLHKWASPAGTITFFERPYCTHNAHYHEASYHNLDKNKCYNLGFTVLAVGLAG